MLRRVKKDVEHELAPKQEKDLLCDMSSRQRTLYRLLRAKLPLSEMFKLADSKIRLENLMNLIMQFRKVCNHPELFERHVGVAPFLFTSVAGPRSRLHTSTIASSAYSSHAPLVRPTLRSPIADVLPRILIDDFSLPSLIAGQAPVLSLNSPPKYLSVQAISSRISLFDIAGDHSSAYVHSIAYLCGLSTCDLRFLIQDCSLIERKIYLRLLTERLRT